MTDSAEPISIRFVPDAASVAQACERVLRALPGWFGVEEAVVAYLEAMARMPTWLAEQSGDVVGFLSLEFHGQSSAEVHVMGVLPDRHRRGVGRALVERAVQFALEKGVARLEVKTLGPSHPDAGYARTRAFYEALGFTPIEERMDIWGPTNPCLVMVKDMNA